MSDSAPGTKGLYVSRADLTAATGVVFVVEHAFADIRDDLHVPVRMQRKATAWSDLIVIPDHETTEAHVRWIALAVDREVVPGLEPVAIATSQGVPGSKLQHLRVSSPACHLPTGLSLHVQQSFIYLSLWKGFL